MKHTLFFLMLFCCIHVSSQTQRGIKSGCITDNYPEISFVWNEYDPAIKDKSQFVLMENGKPVDFTFSHLSQNTGDTRPKTLLFLWEDMVSHRGQYEFSRNLLTGFFNETKLEAGDKFNVAIFNRSNNNSSVLSFLANDFTADKDYLSKQVDGYKKDTHTFSAFPEQSDLYLAINEGIDLLKKQSIDNIGVIVVITAGRNVKASGASTEMASVQIKSLRAAIPIYVIQYPIYGQTPEILSLSQVTYGQTASTVDWRQALAELKNQYSTVSSRYYGQDYQFTFFTSQKMDGKKHEFDLTVAGNPQKRLFFDAPDETFAMWCSENKLWIIPGSLLIIACIVIALAYYKSEKKKRERQRKEDQDEVAQAKREAEEAARKIEQERQDREKAEADRLKKEQKEKQQAEEERLINLMRTKNLYPRLQCILDREQKTFTIQSPVTTIGRMENNDLVLDLPSVSREHAVIKFTGEAFEIHNLSKTNQIIVNGQLIEQMRLKNADKIGLGKAVITFFL